jgi:hypothetical protein
MTVAAKALVQSTNLANVAAVFYTTPVSTTAVIKQFTLTNQGLTPVTVSVWITPTPTAPAASNLVVNERVLGPNEAWSAWPMLGQTLAAGYSIQAICSASTSVAIRVSGLEIT